MPAARTTSIGSPSAPARWLTLVTAICLVLVGCSDDGQPDAGAQVTSPAPTSTPSTTASPTSEAVPTTEPRARDDGRRRVLIVGDSLVFTALSAFDVVLISNDVEVRYVGFSGTGLLSGQGWWNREISAQVEAWHPDVVVIEACCNYANGEREYVDDSGQAVAADSEQMYIEWGAMAADAIDRADDGGAHVLWVRTPCLAYGTLAERADRFNLIVESLGVDRIDWDGALCPDGRYADVIDIGGKTVDVRMGDGVHLTDAGDQLVAAVTWATIADRFDTPADS